MRLPPVAWRRGIGVPCSDVGRSRVEVPMIDDGEWGGVPLGGLGSGSIGRTYRGDFARWHLDIGRHHFEPVPANQFSVFVGRGEERSAHVLSTLRPGTLRSWNWDLPEGAGTYHGLFPNAWFEYDWERLPVRLVQRQFSPIIPGDYRASSYPVGLFEWQIENPGPEPVTVGLMFSWQNLVGFGRNDLAGEPLDRAGGHRNTLVDDGEALGVLFSGPRSAGRRGGDAGTAWDGTFAIASPRTDGVDLTACERFGADDGAVLWADFAADGRLGGHEPTEAGRVSRPGEAIAGAVAATVEVAPGATAAVHFALAWDLPIAEFDAGTRWYRRYTRFFDRSGGNAWAIAREGLARRDEWSAAIEAWQAPVLEDPDRPEWYKSALFNELYFLVDGGTLWTDGRVEAADGDEPDLGRFGLLECFDYAFYNTLDVNFYASFALLRLWPELERQVIRDYVASVEVDQPQLVRIQWTGRSVPSKVAGALPHDLGGPAGDPFLRLNQYRYQDINIWKDLNSKFVLQVWRDIVVLGDGALAREAWSAVVSAIDHLGRFDRDSDGLPEHDGEPDQTYDTWPMAGPGAYSGSLWLAALRAAIEIGTSAGHGAEVGRYRELLRRATGAFELKLWSGRHYRYDMSAGPSAGSIMADQLAGQWYADVSGLGDLVPADHVRTALGTVYEMNVLGFADGEMGAVNGMRSDGTVDDSSEQSAEVWVGTTYALAAFMLGRGMTDEGWRTARGAAAVTYERGLWFRTPEAYDRAGNFRASLYLRPLAIWAIEHALGQRTAG